MLGTVVGKIKIGIAEDGAQRKVDDLEIVGRGRGGQFGEGVKIVEQNEIALHRGIHHRRDLREGLGQTAAHHEKTRGGRGRDLQIHRGAVTRVIVLGEQRGVDVRQRGGGGERLGIHAGRDRGWAAFVFQRTHRFETGGRTKAWWFPPVIVRVICGSSQRKSADGRKRQARCIGWWKMPPVP